MARIAIVLFAVAIAVLGVAAGRAAHAGAPGPSCDSIVVPGGSFSWHPTRVVLDVVNVPPAFLPQTVKTGEQRWRYWSKSGLVVRADSPPVLVSVPAAWRQRVAIGWGNTGPARALLFRSCPPSSSLGGWNPYAGGFYLRTRSVCVPLIVRVGDRSATVRFGIGKRCSGR